jgi:transcriptional regulator of acetoin/glycerol metabolism
VIPAVPGEQQRALTGLADLAEHRARVDAARPRLLLGAWDAGCRNIALLARTAGVSRDTVYKDLAANGVDVGAMTGRQRRQ